ncbi:hypothetical protein PSCLAVI8L_80054 [Pseudoclavibacter sp. 8L]|nr:hypothetical protein PSCLAVI8L_80054 [Pseudoclavibacter sp. 8L]
MGGVDVGRRELEGPALVDASSPAARGRVEAREGVEVVDLDGVETRLGASRDDRGHHVEDAVALLGRRRVEDVLVWPVRVDDRLTGGVVEQQFAALVEPGRGLPRLRLEAVHVADAVRPGVRCGSGVTGDDVEAAVDVVRLAELVVEGAARGREGHGRLGGHLRPALRAAAQGEHTHDEKQSCWKDAHGVIMLQGTSRFFVYSRRFHLAFHPEILSLEKKAAPKLGRLIPKECRCPPSRPTPPCTMHAPPTSRRRPRRRARQRSLRGSPARHCPAVRRMDTPRLQRCPLRPHDRGGGVRIPTTEPLEAQAARAQRDPGRAGRPERRHRRREPRGRDLRVISRATETS